jgi:hypothetical protein
LWDLHDREVARLTGLLNGGLVQRAEADRRDAVESALVDVSEEATRLLRYESSAERALYRSMSELSRQQKIRIAAGIDGEEFSDFAEDDVNSSIADIEPEVPAPVEVAPEPEPEPEPVPLPPPRPRRPPMTKAEVEELTTYPRLLGPDWKNIIERHRAEDMGVSRNEAKLLKALERDRRLRAAESGR